MDSHSSCQIFSFCLTKMRRKFSMQASRKGKKPLIWKRSPRKQRSAWNTSNCWLWKLQICSESILPAIEKSTPASIPQRWRRNASEEAPKRQQHEAINSSFLRSQITNVLTIITYHAKIPPPSLQFTTQWKYNKHLFLQFLIFLTQSKLNINKQCSDWCISKLVRR